MYPLGGDNAYAYYLDGAFGIDICQQAAHFGCSYIHSCHHLLLHFWLSPFLFPNYCQLFYLLTFCWKIVLFVKKFCSRKPFYCVKLGAKKEEIFVLAMGPPSYAFRLLSSFESPCFEQLQ
jgi:hypothetical protein